MRLAETADTGSVQAIYQDAVVHANEVGQIDWPNPVSSSFVTELIVTGELYCFGEAAIEGVAKLSRQHDKRIWGDTPTSALYLAKLATSSRVRGQGYFEHSMLPVIISHAGSDAVLRLDCLADNSRLQGYYGALGFTGLGDVTFFSQKQGRTLVVTRFEKAGL